MQRVELVNVTLYFSIIEHFVSLQIRHIDDKHFVVKTINDYNLNCILRFVLCQ